MLEPAHRLDDGLVQSPVFQDRRGDRGVPVADDRAIGRLVVEELLVPLRTREDVELPHAVQQAGKHRGIRIGARNTRRKRAAHGCYQRAALPEGRERLFQAFQLLLVSKLRDRIRNRSRAHHRKAGAGDRHAQVRDLAAGYVERRGVRNLQDAAGEHGLGAHDALDLFGADILVLERPAHAHRDVGHAWQVNGAP